MGVGRYRGDLGEGHGDLRIVGGEFEVLLVLFWAIVAARKCQDQRILALNLAERTRDAILVGQLEGGECAAGDDVGAHNSSPSGQVRVDWCYRPAAWPPSTCSVSPVTNVA